MSKLNRNDTELVVDAVSVYVIDSMNQYLDNYYDNAPESKEAEAIYKMLGEFKSAVVKSLRNIRERLLA